MNTHRSHKLPSPHHTLQNRPKHTLFTSTKYSYITAYKKGTILSDYPFQYIINQSVYLASEWCSSGDDMKKPG